MENYIVALIDLSLSDYIAMGGKGSGHWRHRGRPGKRGGSAPKGMRAPSIAKGRQDRRKGRHAYAFESKVVTPIGKYNEDKALSALSDMEGGVKEYADTAGIGQATARQRMIWARDAGLLEKTGTGYKLTPLGKSIADKGRADYKDHIALMTGNQDLLIPGRFIKPKAVGYWLYANWPENVSRVRRGEIGHQWYKVTGGKSGDFRVILVKQEQTLVGGKPSAVWEKIADLDQVGLNPSLSREDFV